MRNAIPTQPISTAMQNWRAGQIASCNVTCEPSTASHHTGGDWRRIRYHQAASPEAAMEALDVMSGAIAEAHGEDDEAGSEFSEIRGPNVDYVWSIVHEKQ